MLSLNYAQYTGLLYEILRYGFYTYQNKTNLIYLKKLIRLI